VTIQDLLDAKAKGCHSVDAIIKETKAGMACGRCKEKAELTIIKVLQIRLYI
ncbi:MAG: (2Fe-2S)-binding protein, partial [Romboutsia sp.]|nr:(2Fe-2S)-binding protein [Romboutsia sp.]